MFLSTPLWNKSGIHWNKLKPFIWKKMFEQSLAEADSSVLKNAFKNFSRFSFGYYLLFAWSLFLNLKAHSLGDPKYNMSLKPLSCNKIRLNDTWASMARSKVLPAQRTEALSIHRPRFCSPSPTMVMFLYEKRYRAGRKQNLINQSVW